MAAPLVSEARAQSLWSEREISLGAVQKPEIMASLPRGNSEASLSIS